MAAVMPGGEVAVEVEVEAAAGTSAATPVSLLHMGEGRGVRAVTHRFGGDICSQRSAGRN